MKIMSANPPAVVALNAMDIISNNCCLRFYKEIQKMPEL